MLKPDGPFWITRDSGVLSGALDVCVSVWSARPYRVGCLAGAFWTTATAHTPVVGQVGRLPAETVRRWIAATGNSLPDTDRECIRVG